MQKETKISFLEKLKLKITLKIHVPQPRAVRFQAQLADCCHPFFFSLFFDDFNSKGRREEVTWLLEPYYYQYYYSLLIGRTIFLWFDQKETKKITAE
jgi:hypothetical protein